VLFRCDADADVGLGHASRCTAIADALHERGGCEISFALRHGPLGCRWIEARGYEVHLHDSAEGDDGGSWLVELADTTNARVVVLDVRDDLSCEAIQEMRERGIRIATLDDGSERRWLADEAFYPPVGADRRLDWSGFNGVLHEGWDWIALRPEFMTRSQGVRTRIPNVLVAMGGTDPAGLTPRTLRALHQLQGEFRVCVLLGPDSPLQTRVEELLSSLGRSFELLLDPPTIAPLMGRSDLAIASFGVTAFELASQGVPTVLLSLSDDHAASAGYLAAEGAAVNLGVHSRVSDEAFVKSAARLIEDADLRSEMSKRATRLIDGRGAERIADRIVSLGVSRA
jgi:spore coat polysaccharide biosynthesis protein SpsF